MATEAKLPSRADLYDREAMDWARSKHSNELAAAISAHLPKGQELEAHRGSMSYDPHGYGSYSHDYVVTKFGEGDDAVGVVHHITLQLDGTERTVTVWLINERSPTVEPERDPGWAQTLASWLQAIE